MLPSTLQPELDHPELINQPRPAAPFALLIAGIAATAALLASLADVGAPEPYVPNAIRALAYVGALVAWANWFGRRAEDRADRRFDVLESKVESRLIRAAAAEAYVDGLARVPWDPEKYK